MTDPKTASSIQPNPFKRSLLYNCLTLVVIFTLCLYGLGVVGLYMRWFVLSAPPPETEEPYVITVVLPTAVGEEQEPIIITVVSTRPPDPNRTATSTLEPTPTQWLPPPTATSTQPPLTPGTGITDTVRTNEPAVIRFTPTVLDDSRTATARPEMTVEPPQAGP